VTLDPGTAAFLEQIGDAFSLAVDTEEEKAALLEGLATPEARDGGGLGGEPEPMAHIEDRLVSAPGNDVPVRVYRPEGESLPLIVFMHGGVFILGGLEMHDAVLRRLANALPAVIVSVDYRLAPDHPFPAAVDDSYTVLQWAAEQIAELGADPDQLVIMGDSAGGALAAVLAGRARDQGGPTIALQVLLYPMVDPRMDTGSAREFATGHLTTTSLLRFGWNLYLRDATDAPYSSPAALDDLAGLPPAIVMTAGHDPLRDEGLAYAERLRRSSVDVEAMHYLGQIHGFAFMPAVIPEADGALKSLVEAMHAALTP
jgi:acetyl esterase